jgi:hypothetical protein
LVGLVGLVGRGFAGRAALAGPWAPGAVGAIPGPGRGPGAMVKVDDPVLALEGAGPVARGATVVGGGLGGTPEDLAGSSGPKTVEATIAAVTAEVSPKATSSRRQGGRCSARWRGLGGGMARRRAWWGRSLASDLTDCPTRMRNRVLIPRSLAEPTMRSDPATARWPGTVLKGWALVMRESDLAVPDAVQHGLGRRATASLGSSLGPLRMERSYSSAGTRTDRGCP